MRVLHRHRLLLWALALSALIHLSLLTFRWLAPDTYARVFKDTPLEITLVNARSEERPDKPHILAQAQLAGGGNTPVVELSSSPLPAQPSESEGEAMDTTTRQLELLRMQQSMLLSILRQELTELERHAQGQSSTTLTAEQEQRRQLLTRQLSQIERRAQAAQKGPRKRYISPATQEVPYAIYYDRMRRNIEQQGTEHFPEVSGRKLYGSLIMAITVDSDGQLLSADVAESSGNPLLDARALAIVRSTAPFGPFSARMRKHSDQIVVVARFRFARDDQLRTRMLAPREE